MNPLIEIDKITKIYPPDVVALRNITCQIQKKEIIFITGASGAGKSTLLKLLCCLEKANSGTIKIGGNSLETLKPRAIQKLRQRVGVAYQNFRLLPDKTVFHNISLAMEVRYAPPRQIRSRVDFLLDQLALADKKNKLTGNLSRGEQQRVAIARAAANNPSLLLADEPTGNLDPLNTGLVMDFFEHLNDQGATIIIATHDKSIYQNTSHRVMVLDENRLHDQKELN